MSGIERFEATIGLIPSDWRVALGPAASRERIAPIAEYVAEQCQTARVLPDPGRVFAALRATPIDAVRAVILGQESVPEDVTCNGSRVLCTEGLWKSASEIPSEHPDRTS